MQGTRVPSLVRELDPTCMLQLRVHMPQLRSPPAATKEHMSHNQDPVQPKKRPDAAKKKKYYSC